jgi:ABC-type molybdate transport system substrate-binding protein
MNIILAAVMAWMGLGAVAAGPAWADEVKVFSAGAVRAIVSDLSEQFRQETGHTVTSPSARPVRPGRSSSAGSRWTW